MWNDLTLKQKAEIMKMSVANGVTDINDIQQLYDGSVGHKFDGGSRIITLADLPREYVQKYGHINVVTPKGVRMPLSQAYRDYNQTTINVNDVPGLTNYLIKQDNPDIQEQAHLDKLAADREIRQRNNIINGPIFDKKKIYNRVPGDMWQAVVSDKDGQNIGANRGIVRSLFGYYFNPDNAVESRLQRYEKYKDLSMEEVMNAGIEFDRMWEKYGLDSIRNNPILSRKMTELESKMRAPHVLQHEDAKDLYLGLPQRNNTMKDAEYSPTNGKLRNGKYISYMRDPAFVNDVIMKSYNDLKHGFIDEETTHPGLYKDHVYNKRLTPVKEITPRGYARVEFPFLNNATLSGGIDPQRGEYASIFDTWDYNTNIMGTPGDNVGEYIGGEPFDIYDRYYLDDYYGINSKPQDDGYYGGYLPELSVVNKKALGGHLYKNAGQLDKAKNQPRYQYGIIEQILRENGVNFRVTSGARKPNQAGNAGKSSAHTYTIFGNSPGAIDIVPGVGSDWNTLFAQMSSPKVRRALAAYGLDILNETNPSVMASTKATGPHLHVGRGIKGQQGLGQIFGGTSYGGGRGDTYRLQYPSQRNSNYTPMYSQNAFEPMVIGGNNTSNPWLDYIRSVESIDNQGINPVFNTPIRPTNTGLNGIKSTFTPTDFSSLSNSNDIVSPLEPYAAKQNIEYGLGLEGNALWNSPYLMFDNHSAANGGHLFDTAGQMLIRDNAVNPALRYVYGDDYEEYIKQLRNYRPANTERRVKPRYNLSQQTDVIGNTAKPVNKSIRNKQINSPQRKQKEQKLANDRYWQNERERQGTISQARDIVRDPVYNREFANEVQALREREAEEAKKRYPVDLAMKQGLEFAGEAMRPLFITSDIGALFDPNTRSVGDFFANIWSPNNKGIFNINQDLRSWYDANPELAEGINLGIDLFGPGILGKAAKGVSKAGKAMATDFISDMRMLPSKYNAMRYELAHPEAQTLGIIPDRLNPFIGKKTYNKKINQVQDLIQNQPTYVDVNLDLPNARVPATLSTGYKYRKNLPQIFLERIKVPYYQTDFTGPIPMEQGFTLMPGEMQTGINWKQTNRVFTPDRILYDIAIPDGVSGTPLQVKNIFGDVRGNAPVNIEGIKSAVFPEGSRFSSPMFGEIRYNYDGTRPQMSELGRINMRGEKPTNGSVINAYDNYNYTMFDPEVRASLPPYLSKDHEIRVAAKQYVDDLERRLVGKNGKPLASVEGSYRAVSEGLPHSPQDVEFLVPENNVEALKKLFNVKSSTEMPNGFGIQVTSKEFDELLEKTADFQIIRKGKGGGATGNTAWQIYEYLHPKEAQELSRNYIRKVAKNERSQAAKNYREAVELPLSPQELFDEYMASGMNKKKYLFDMMGSPKDKHVLRKNSMGLGVGSDSDKYYNALVEKIHSEFPGAKTLAEQGYKLDYTNVEANKKFLEYWGLPEYYADKPEQMRIIVEQQMHAYQTVHRGTNIAIPGQSGKSWVNTPVEDRIEGALKLNVDAGGGSSAGPGANTTNQIGKTTGDTGLIRETEIARQLPLTYKSEVIESIKNPEDLVNRMKKIKELSTQNEPKLRMINDLQHQDEMDRLARELDLPFWTEERNYSSAGNYVGITGYDDIASAIRYNGDVRGGAFEITKPFKFKDDYASSRWLVDRGFEEEFYNNLMNAAEANPDLVSLINRRQKLFEIRNKLNTRRNRTNTAINAGKYLGTAGGVGGVLTAGGYYGLGALTDHLSKNDAKKDPLLYKSIAEHYNKELNVIKNWNINQKPSKEVISAISSIERYKDKKFNKMSREEKIQYKKDIIEGLEDEVKRTRELYNYGITNGKSLEELNADIESIEGYSFDAIKAYLSDYDRELMRGVDTMKELDKYRAKALERAKEIKTELTLHSMKRIVKKQ